MLTERLRPADEDFVAEEIRPLLEILPFPASMNPQSAPAAYGYALKGIPRHGLRVAVRKVIRGEYDKLNRAFMPTPPELAALARSEVGTTVQDLVRAKEIREAMTAEPLPPSSEASKARVRELLQKFRQHHAASKATAGNNALHEPMDEERLERFCQIRAMPEKPGIDAEQIAFARQIGAKLDEQGPAR